MRAYGLQREHHDFLFLSNLSSLMTREQIWTYSRVQRTGRGSRDCPNRVFAAIKFPFSRQVVNATTAHILQTVDTAYRLPGRISPHRRESHLGDSFVRSVDLVLLVFARYHCAARCLGYTLDDLCSVGVVCN